MGPACEIISVRVDRCGHLGRTPVARFGSVTACVTTTCCVIPGTTGPEKCPRLFTPLFTNSEMISCLPLRHPLTLFPLSAMDTHEPAGGNGGKAVERHGHFGLRL